MLDVGTISVSYGMHRALSEVSIAVEQKEIVVILGANGAGKSTLLKSIAGMCEGSVAGRITLDGEDITTLEPHDIVDRGVAFVPEGRGIFGDLTVAENLLLGAYSQRARERQDANLSWIYSLFPKLTERRNQVARTMSGGEQQMVAIGRAMMADPKILMLDEPSLGLSPLLCKELFQSLAHISDAGMGVLLVEQNAKQSLAIADRGYLIENGEITGSGDAASLLNDPAVQAAYLGAGSARPPSGRQTSAPAAPAASEKHFIRPGGATRNPTSTDALAGESITSMISRATGSAQGRYTAAKPASATSTGRSPAASRSATIPSGASAKRDPEVARIIAEIEQAARAAMSGGASAADRNSHRTEDDHDGS